MSSKNQTPLNMLKKINLKKFRNSILKKFPDKNGRFGKFGGRFEAETLMPLLLNVQKNTKKLSQRNAKSELNYHFENYIGRPSPLYFAKRISKEIKNAKIYFKRIN